MTIRTLAGDLLKLLTLWTILPVAASSGRQLFNIVDFGATRDGSVLATEAFRQAILAAKAAGDGTIYVPPGKYISGPIELFSNMILDVDAGATIEFPVAPLPFTKGRYLGIETLTQMPLIGGHDVENVTVTGLYWLTAIVTVAVVVTPPCESCRDTASPVGVPVGTATLI